MKNVNILMKSRREWFLPVNRCLCDVFHITTCDTFQICTCVVCPITTGVQFMHKIKWHADCGLYISRVECVSRPSCVM